MTPKDQSPPEVTLAPGSELAETDSFDAVLERLEATIAEHRRSLPTAYGTTGTIVTDPQGQRVNDALAEIADLLHRLR